MNFSELRRFPQGPYIIGWFFLVFGFAFLAIWEVENGLWCGKDRPSAMLEKAQTREFPFLQGWLQEKGKDQNEKWNKRKKEAEDDYSISSARMTAFHPLLKDNKSPSFLSARDKYQEEKRVNEALKKKKDTFNDQPGWKGFFGLLLIYLLILTIFITSSYCLDKMSKTHLTNSPDLEDWKLPYIFFFLQAYLCQSGVVIYTSIWKVEKLWIGATSFFVSWEAWVLERVTVLGLTMITAIPATQLWCCLSKKAIPDVPSIWLYRLGSDFVIEKYVQFLQCWTLVIFGAFTVITVVTIWWAASYQDQFENAYLVITLAGAVVAVLIIGKMIRNAMELRKRYYLSLSKFFHCRKEIKAFSVPEDPTLDFIGASWWKLPANFVGIATAAWALLQFSGVDKIILGPLK